MKPISYLVSADLDYGKLICRDAGPSIASDYGWSTDTVSKAAIERPGVVVVVDNRITPDEIRVIEESIVTRATSVVLRVVDPCFSSGDQPYYQFCQRVAVRQNVHFMMTYGIAEWTESLMRAAANKKYVHAPYLYRQEHEHPITASRRRNAVLLSGHMSRDLYPVRYHFRRKTRRSPVWRLFSPVLKHPGYPDVGEVLRHSVILDAYVKKLATYRYAFVCSSRARCELLKYRELAYAGCAPVGDLPTTLADCPDDAFVQARTPSLALFAQTILGRHDRRIAQAFREYMRKKRDRASVAETVGQQLLALRPVRKG